MAKSKAKTAIGKIESAPLHDPTMNPSKHALTSFDEVALSNLTKNLEMQFSKSDGVKQATRGKKERKYSENRDNIVSEDKSGNTVNGNRERSVKGKKRSRKGDILPEQPTKENKGKQIADKKGSSYFTEEERLALGVTEEDLQLIGDADSASEMSGGESGPGRPKSSGGKKSVVKGLQSMVKDIIDKDGGAGASLELEDSEATESEPEPASRHAPPSTKPTKPPIAISGGIMPIKISRGMLMEPRPDWHSVSLLRLPDVPVGATNLPKPLLDRLHAHAKILLDTENQAYAATTEKSSSSHKFYSTIMTSGTLTDKVSALTLSVQESPLHSMKALENLLGLARKRSRAQAVDVLRALKDLFSQGGLLPSDRRLKHFYHQPGLVAAFHGSRDHWKPGDRLPRNLESKHLIFWAFEHWLKDLYFEILKILEIWCNDEIEFARSRAVSYVYELLKEKPEQESNLLRLLVNKLGDPNKKIASRASYLLLQLETTHPMMKATIISAVEAEFLFKPGQSQHAKYYAVITLNQTSLSVKDGEVANKLLDIYFNLFVAILKPENSTQRSKAKSKKEKDEAKGIDLNSDHENALREKMISAILTGVNRAYPYSLANGERLSKHIDALFRITHSSNFNTSIQALMLIQQLSSTHQVSADRYYRTLYESLLDPRLITSSKQSLYLNLLYRSLKADMNIKRLKAFIKRIVQVLSLHQPSFIYGSFHLIKELEKTFPSVKTLMDHPEDADSDSEEVFRDVPEEGTRSSPPPQAQQSPRQSYDPRKRDPEHSNADFSCLWEIQPFLSHFHPSVAVSGLHVLDHSPLEGKPDLSVHTLIHFLDRFVYRNPKAEASALRGSSLMQPLAGSSKADLLVTATAGARSEVPVNDEGFWKKAIGDVAAEDAFFHQYFANQGKDKRVKKTKKDRRADDSQTDEEEEDEIWKALVRSKNDVEPPEEDSDIDFDEDDMNSDEADENLEDALAVDLDEEASAGSVDEEMLDGTAEAEALSDDPWADSDDETTDLDMTMSGALHSAKADAGSTKDTRKKKRKTLNQLPTFASAEDYMAMIENEEGEDLG